MRKKTFSSDLHSTRGNKYHPNLGLTGITFMGEGFSKKANSHYRYTNRNTKGVSNTIEWL